MRYDDTPASPKFLGRQLLKAAIVREIFDPFTGDVLDVSRAVLIDGTDHGHGMYVMTVGNWEKAEGPLFARYGKENFTVYDGRELYS